MDVLDMAMNHHWLMKKMKLIAILLRQKPFGLILLYLNRKGDLGDVSKGKDFAIKTIRDLYEEFTKS